MNYHIIPQNKFFETYIDDIYQINQESNNIIWVRGDRGQSPFFRTNHPVKYLGNNSATIKKHFLQIKPEDNLFVAWYDLFIGGIVLESKLSSRLFVYLMGAEFYAQPEWWHNKRLFDPRTRRNINKKRFFPTYFPVRTPWKWYKWLFFKKQLKKEYSRKIETIKRIDYIILPEHASYEINLLTRMYPGFRAKHLIGTFDQNYDLANNHALKSTPTTVDIIKIWLGNSSDPSGNQIDAIYFLNKTFKRPFEVYCPLSYGDREAELWITEYGTTVLGERFHPVTSFFDRVSFIDYLNEMDIIVMFHNRQQAAGTVITSLALGKPVFMKPNSPLFCQLKSMGIKTIHSIYDLKDLDPIQTIQNSQTNHQDTLVRIEKEYSDSTRLGHLKKLLMYN